MPESPLLMVPDGFRVDRVFMNLQGRHTADVRYDPERPGRSGGALTVSVYRSVDHDEAGIQCGNGSISAYDGAVYWYIRPPEDVMRRA